MTNKQLMDIPAPNSASKPRLKVTKSVPILPPSTARRIQLQTNRSNRTALRTAANEDSRNRLPMNNDFGPEPEPYLEPVQIRSSANKQPPTGSAPTKATPASDKKTLTWCGVPVPPPKIVVELQQQREKQGAVKSKQNQSVDKEENLAYLVVDLKTGIPSFNTTVSFDDLHTVLREESSSDTENKLPTRSFTMSSIGDQKKRPKPAPKPKIMAKDSFKDPTSLDSSLTEDHRKDQQTSNGESPASRPKPVVPRHSLSKLTSVPPTCGGGGRDERQPMPTVLSDTALVKRWTISENETKPHSTVKPPGKHKDEGNRRHSFKLQSRHLEDSFSKESVSSKDSTSSREQSPSSDSSSKQLAKRPPSRPPPPSAAVLTRAKTLKSKSPSSIRHMSTTSISPRLLPDNRQSIDSCYEGIDLNSEELSQKIKPHLRSSISSASSGIVSPISLSDTDKLTYPNDNNVYEEIDAGFPIPPPRLKKRRSKKSANLQNRKLQKSDIGPPEPVPRDCHSAPLVRRNIVLLTSPPPTMAPTMPPPLPPKQSSKFREASNTDSKTSFTLGCEKEEEVYIDPSELVSKVPGSEEPDIGGMDEYVDMDSLSAWNPDSGSTDQQSKATAEELASDKPEDSYVEMHPAVSNAVEDQEEPVYIEMDATVYIPPPSPPISVHYASKDLLAKRPDLKHTKNEKKTSSTSSK